MCQACQNLLNSTSDQHQEQPASDQHQGAELHQHQETSDQGAELHQHQEQPRALILQRTFGAIVEMSPLMPVAPVRNDCSQCGSDDGYKTNDDGDVYCDDCYDEAYATCSNCGKEVDRDDIMQNAQREHYCEECYNDAYVSCEDCSEELDLHGDQVYSPENGSGIYCESCYDSRYIRCAACNDEVRRNNAHEGDDDYYCESCYCERYNSCDGCGCTVSNDDTYSTDDGVYCEGCYPGEDSETGKGGRDYKARRFTPSAPATRAGSSRRFGVELETSNCPDYCDLEGKVYFGTTDDGTVTGKEFVSAILSGDAGLAAIDDFCESAEELGFEVDSKCGFHAHFDVSDLNTDQLRAVACAYSATSSTWRTFVSSERREDHYCGPESWDCDEVVAQEDFADWMSKLDRYQWINLKAYAEHNTFEVRLHNGTIVADKVTNWVIAHLRFIDAVSKMTVAQVRAKFEGKSAWTNFWQISEIWDNDELTDFYANRAAKFGMEYRTDSAPNDQETSDQGAELATI
jgi:hypothetical protein